jgi:hypothetical protein
MASVDQPVLLFSAELSTPMAFIHATAGGAPGSYLTHHILPISGVESQIMHTSIVSLPNFRWFEFKGPSADMEAVVHRITSRGSAFCSSSNPGLPFTVFCRL